VRACVIAPVGEAYRYLHHHNPALWNKLYSWDDFHPSPHGTWLQACVIYCTCFGTKTADTPQQQPRGDSGSNKNSKSVRLLLPPQPPVYNPLWWEKSRYMQPPDQKPLPLPTAEEAMELRRVACLVCGVPTVGDAGGNREAGIGIAPSAAATATTTVDGSMDGRAGEEL
jgi:hypothetical protein